MPNLKATNTTKGAKMFKLKLKDGVEVSTLEELRENFDLERVVEYFQSGDLLTWLEDRFYDDEADAISEIDNDDRNFTAKICAALNVECDEDLGFMQRVREKKAILAEKTDDESIIDNAVSTALNQEDLAALIQMDYKTIFLCGELFNVPIRIADRKYIGILGTPKIKIRAKSQDELDANNISFENVQLPWQKDAPIDELKVLAEKIFQTGGKFPIVKAVLNFEVSSRQFDILSPWQLKTVASFDELDRTKKSMVLRMICQGKYEEHQIAYMQLTEDLSSGFALTVDSFCTGGGIGSNIISYKEIKLADNSGIDSGWLRIKFSNREVNFTSNLFVRAYNRHACETLFSPDDYDRIAQFLEVAKNF